MPKELWQPTEAQCQAFAYYISGAHSWYKHIPLLTGAEFAFFLSKQAGAGYSVEKPRLHYSWQTTDEYRDRFGYLDYGWRFKSTDRFDRDAVGAVSLSPILHSACCVVLYPYVADNINAPSVLASPIMPDDLVALQESNYSHWQSIQQWLAAYHQQDQQWQTISQAERNQVIAWEPTDAGDLTLQLATLPPPVAHYLHLEKQAMTLYTALQTQELHKIQLGLARLRQLCLEGAAVWM